MSKIFKIAVIVFAVMILIAAVLTIIGPADRDEFYQVYPDRATSP